MKKEQQLQTTLSNYQKILSLFKVIWKHQKNHQLLILLQMKNQQGKLPKKKYVKPQHLIKISTSEELIKVWNFYNGKLELFQTLKGHDKVVTCLYFIRKNNWFISGSRDKTIRLWKEFSNSECGCMQILEGNSFCFNSVIMNQYEDQTSRDDHKIKVWMQESLLSSQQPKWKCYQTLQDHKKNVYSLSLNQAGIWFL
ncbi:unnamed protein product [Paramecium primaurelia]|uniref:Uncharacterized protein n=1 Tax=Paramecium primaurelia TaxID=5886 RepID=A0A8S1Q4L3_PARPR|nr:unnamed protein product [Paramecium primaurelia]